MAYDYDKLKKMELYQVGSGTEPYAIADRKAREGLVEAQEDIDEILEDIADLQEEDVKLKEDLAQQERSLDLLWKLNKGIAYTLETDEEVKSNKVIPSGAMAFNLDVIGGMSVKENDQIINSDCNKIVVCGKNIFNQTINKTAFGVKAVLSGSTLSFTGTATEGLYYSIELQNPIVLKANTDYTFSFDYDNQKTILFSKKDDISGELFQLTPSQKNKTVKYASDTTITHIFSWITSGTTYNNHITIQLELGTTATSYEPYHAPKEYTIPQAIRNLDGYGWGINANCYNYIDFNTMKYHKKIDRVAMSSLSWSYNSTSKNFFADVSGMVVVPTGDESVSTILTNYFNTINRTTNVVSQYNVIWQRNNVAKRINARKEGVTSVTDFIALVEGSYLYYELAEEEVTDISDLIPSELLEAILCEANGTIKFNMSDSTYAIDIPNKEEYIIKVSEATS